MRKRKEYLDERQQIERGKAFRNAFLTLLIALIVCVIINRVLINPIIDYYFTFVIPVMISIVVLYSTLVLRDALKKRTTKEDEDELLVFSMLIVICSVIALVIIVLKNTPLIKDGVLDEIYLLAFGMLSLTEIGSVYIIKYIKDRRKAKISDNTDQIE